MIHKLNKNNDQRSAERIEIGDLLPHKFGFVFICRLVTGSFREVILAVKTRFSGRFRYGEVPIVVEGLK